tara:strand:+ start:997 stop:1197 length:201 start_codon:yes stop_codon:yes gene_type:complete
MNITKSELQKIIHNELKNTDGLDSGQSILLAIEITRKVMRLDKLESKDSKSLRVQASSVKPVKEGV